MFEHPGQIIQKENLTGLISESFKESMTDATIMAGFRKTGIFPFSSEAVPMVRQASMPSQLPPTVAEETKSMKLLLDGVVSTYTTPKKAAERPRTKLIPDQGLPCHHQ